MTLLAHLVRLLAKSPEDVATEALSLLLNRSEVANGAVQKLLQDWCAAERMPITQWRSQVAGADAARTDLEGSTIDGKTIAILENKFWAGLTDNQPATYLDRLPSDCGAVVFVAPAVRVPILQREVADRARKLGELPNGLSEFGATFRGRLVSGRTLVVTGWPTILAAIKNALEVSQDFDMLADLGQLNGLVQKMDREGFRPFSTADLTGNAGQLINQACSIVDQAIWRLVDPPRVDKTGLRAAAGAGWFGHGFRMDGYGCNLMFSAERWSRLGISPIWLRVSSSSWTFPEQAAVRLRQLTAASPVEEVRSGDWQGVWMPIRLPEGREERDVVDSVLQQISAISQALPPEAGHPPATSQAASDQKH